MVSPSPIRRNARDRAMQALVRSFEGEVFVRDALEEMQAADPLSPADAALAAELTLGVLRRRLTCEHLAARFYRGRWQGLRVPVRMILALGVYQLCWLDRVPDHAAVDQAVRQARRHGRGTAGLVNGILRSLARCRGERIECPAAPDPRRYLPLDARHGRLFGENVFPDPARRPLESLIAVTSHPSWLVERWHRRFKPALCRQVCDAGARRPPLILRPNPLRTDARSLLDRLTAAGRPAELTGDGDSVLLPDGPRAADIPEIDAGLCQPQDTTAQRALRLAPPQTGDCVVDLCAGAGTKATQAAEMMRDCGTVIATDIHAEKLVAVRASAERLGLHIIHPTPIERLGDALARVGRPPDLILVDAPCLNTGVLARRPEARYRAGAKALRAVVELQRGILQHARDLAGPRTRIVYATCSLEQEENETQVAAFCDAAPEWKVDRQVFTLPDATRDGGFAAVLVR